MPNPHFDISIVQRSKGKSAVAGAAYQSGEKLFSEYDQTYKDYRNKLKAQKGKQPLKNGRLNKTPKTPKTTKTSTGGARIGRIRSRRFL